MKTMKIGDKNIKVSTRKNINFSAGAIEMEGALILFKRSVQLHGFRYTEMLGDGDAKTHSRLLQEDPYDGRPIEKLECVNHVTKRMGTALRNLVKKKKRPRESRLERWGNLMTVDTALAIAVQRFNKGASALQDVMLELELVTGSTVEDFALKEDTARVRKATTKSSDKEKEKRKKMDTVRRREQQERREREGEVYGPGQF
ncbi:hypothetical protein ACOMHN_006327 [Nucella lapillus]